MKSIFSIIFLFLISLVSLAAEIQTFILKSEILKDGSKRVEIDLNHDGKLDRIETYKNGVLTSFERESNFSGHFDEWTTYAP